ncbi:hypothetical protein KKC13_06110 [bacterium]|nr:hypothetical protein [bacterium]MBU1958968.1 hypothetical protein [bacterium]
MAMRNWGNCHWCGKTILTEHRPPNLSKMYYFCSNSCMSSYQASLR